MRLGRYFYSKVILFLFLLQFSINNELSQLYHFDDQLGVQLDIRNDLNYSYKTIDSYDSESHFTGLPKKDIKKQSTTPIIEKNEVYNESSIISIENNEALNSSRITNNWKGTGDINDPIIISGLKIADPWAFWQVSLINTSLYVKIENNFISARKFAIQIQSASNIILENNIIMDFFNGGIMIDRVQNLTILNNTIIGKGTAINLAQSNYSIIQNNTIKSEYNYGINVAAGSYHALIEKNIIYETQYGMELQYVTANSTISGNLFQNCVALAVKINSNVYNLFEYNTFYYCQNPFYICTPTPIVIRYNNFILKDQESDFGLVYDNIVVYGNFYSSWVEPDLDEDGIIDRPKPLNPNTHLDLTPSAKLFPENRIQITTNISFDTNKMSDITLSINDLSSNYLVNWTPCITNIKYPILYTLNLYCPDFESKLKIWQGYNKTEYIFNASKYNTLINCRFTIGASYINEENIEIQLLESVSSTIIDIRREDVQYTFTTFVIDEFDLNIKPLYDEFGNSFSYSVILIPNIKNKNINDYRVNGIWYFPKDSFYLSNDTNVTEYSFNLKEIPEISKGDYKLVIVINFGNQYITHRYEIIYYINPIVTFASLAVILIGILGLFLIFREIKKKKTRLKINHQTYLT
jgi:hypothetical protein